MLLAEQLIAGFHPVVDLGDGLFRCSDELLRTTHYTYFMLGHAITPFLLSQDHVDDAFARQVLTQAGHDKALRLEFAPLPQNTYGLTHLLRAPHDFHSELEGRRFDDARPQTTLCIPVHRSEFSGDETAAEFRDLRLHVVPTRDWARPPAPKIALRFDNTKTGGGTAGEGYMFAKLGLLLREVENLAGDDRGFIEIINYRGQVVELLSPTPDTFTWISNRDDAAAVAVRRAEVAPRITAFLTD